MKGCISWIIAKWRNSQKNPLSQFPGPFTAQFSNVGQSPCSVLRSVVVTNLYSSPYFCSFLTVEDS